MSKHEIDDAAYEALKAHPKMLEEAMTNASHTFWAKSARILDNQDYILYGAYMADIRDAYVKEQVEDYADTWEISANEAIDRLLKECNK